MTYQIKINQEFPSLNEFINANRTGKGRWNKGNYMKQRDQGIICACLYEQLRKVHIDKPITINYVFYCKNRKRDLDNISSYFHKVFQDALVQAKVIHNDSWQYITGFSDSFFVDAQNPRIEIELVEREK